MKTKKRKARDRNERYAAAMTAKVESLVYAIRQAMNKPARRLVPIYVK